MHTALKCKHDEIRNPRLKMVKIRNLHVTKTKTRKPNFTHIGQISTFSSMKFPIKEKLTLFTRKGILRLRLRRYGPLTTRILLRMSMKWAKKVDDPHFFEFHIRILKVIFCRSKKKICRTGNNRTVPPKRHFSD